MIKFFRRIRQRLLAGNKLSSYFLYAIGEIILVVIGILIALQINNWNEERKNNKTAQHYLSALKEEFEYNKEHLSGVVRLNNRNIQHALEILKYTGPGDPVIEVKFFDSILLNTIGYEVEIRPRNEVINEVTATGKLSLFNNPELRTTLSSWASMVQWVRFQEAELSRYRFQLIDLTMEQINFRGMVYNAEGEIFGITNTNFNNENSSILRMQKFESLLTSFIGSSNFANQRFKRLEDKIDEINHLINQEL